MFLQVERRRFDADERHPKVREDLVRGVRSIDRQNWHLKAGLDGGRPFFSADELSAFPCLSIYLQVLYDHQL